MPSQSRDAHEKVPSFRLFVSDKDPKPRMPAKDRPPGNIRLDKRGAAVLLQFRRRIRIDKWQFVSPQVVAAGVPDDGNFL
jgi:hypothetical protein